MNNEYQQCVVTVMDNIADSNIRFDEKVFAITIMNILRKKKSMLRREMKESYSFRKE